MLLVVLFSTVTDSTIIMDISKNPEKENTSKDSATKNVTVIPDDNDSANEVPVGDLSIVEPGDDDDSANEMLIQRNPNPNRNVTIAILGESGTGKTSAWGRTIYPGGIHTMTYLQVA